MASWGWPWLVSREEDTLTIDIDVAEAFEACLRCGESVTVTPPEGWEGWCAVCREGWLRWWNNPKAHPDSPSRRLAFRP